MTTHDPNYWQPRLAALAAGAAGKDGAHDASHLGRVWRTAQTLLKDHPEANPLVVMAACYLHDLVNLPKNDPERSQASRRSARLARQRLGGMAFPPDLLDGVAHAIEAHSYSAAIPAENIEAKIVQDADRIDALGAIGLARVFHVGGQLGRPLAHADDPLALGRPLDDRTYTLDHFVVKLAALPGMMQTAAGRRVAERRVSLLMDFRERFANEWLGRSADE